MALILAGIATLAILAIWATARGLATAWLGAALLVAGAYALCGFASFTRRGRTPATIGAAVLTLAIVIVTFLNVWLMLAGLAVTAGCALPAERR